MVVALLVLAGIAVFVLAAIVIGRESRRLDAVAPRAIYDVDEAVAFVCERLPMFAARQLTPDEVRQLLRWHMTQLRQHGLQPPKPVDQRQSIDLPVVIEEDGAVGYLIGRAEDNEMAVPDEAIVMVIEAHFEYFRAIGAVGPPAFDPDVEELHDGPKE